MDKGVLVLLILTPFIIAEVFHSLFKGDGEGWSTPRYETEGFMAGAPANDAAFYAMTMHERQYWLGRGSSPEDSHYEYILAREFPYRQYCEELKYVEMPNGTRPYREDLPKATFRACVAKAKFDEDRKRATFAQRYPD